jgi:hypothetical protein
MATVSDDLLLRNHYAQHLAQDCPAHASWTLVQSAQVSRVSMRACCWERQGALTHHLVCYCVSHFFSKRHILHFGRDDVTTFYTDLLRRVSFPYQELDLNRRLDWQMMDELTTRTCTLLDVSHEVSV